MTIKIGSLNTRGPKGDQGPKGIKGSKGDPGSNWLTGQGKPIDEIGVVGDMYLDVVRGDVYKKDLSGWVFKGNIKGPKGQKGDKGPIGWSQSTVVSDGGSGEATQAPKLIQVFETDLVTDVNDLVVVNGNNSVTKITNNLLTTIPNGIFGIGVSKPTALTINVQFIGIISGYSGFTIGQPLYVSVSGGLSHVKPTTGVLQQIGFAVGSDKIFMNLRDAIARA